MQELEKTKTSTPEKRTRQRCSEVNKGFIILVEKKIRDKIYYIEPHYDRNIEYLKEKGYKIKVFSSVFQAKMRSKAQPKHRKLNAFIFEVVFDGKFDKGTFEKQVDSWVIKSKLKPISGLEWGYGLNKPSAYLLTVKYAKNGWKDVVVVDDPSKLPGKIMKYKFVPEKDRKKFTLYYYQGIKFLFRKYY